MGEIKNVKHFGVDQLENELKTPIQEDRQAWRILEKLAECFIDVSRGVDNIKLEVFGNGVPGGLKAQVIRVMTEMESMQAKQDSIESKLDLIIQSTLEDKKTKSDIENKVQERKDSFQGFIDWFSNKVLPSVVSYIIMTCMLIFAFAVVWASGLVKLSLP